MSEVCPQHQGQRSYTLTCGVVGLVATGQQGVGGEKPLQKTIGKLFFWSAAIGKLDIGMI